MSWLTIYQSFSFNLYTKVFASLIGTGGALFNNSARRRVSSWTSECKICFVRSYFCSFCFVLVLLHATRNQARPSLLTKKQRSIMGGQSSGSSACSEESFVKMPTIKFTKLFINGEFIDSVSGKTFETIDPRTGEVITRVAEGDKEDVDLAVKAARAAFDHGPWPRLPGAVNIYLTPLCSSVLLFRP
ncbi:putative oxidoreductase [Rosa chinensis]|uniref:Putative oxidoreductase n=1 Tax=Rosa chinensis TaxID=74649 RepID=A0A2P6RGD4_ROSCH|nr:putative oxidoreductase [Rosa chinensis]